MKVRELISELAALDPTLDVEIATCPRPDEWYEIPDIDSVEVLPNLHGNLVAVINTD